MVKNYPCTTAAPKRELEMMNKIGTAIPVTGQGSQQGCGASRLPYFLDNRLVICMENISLQHTAWTVGTILCVTVRIAYKTKDSEHTPKLLPLKVNY
jgi:hypothetical protein